MSEKRESIDDKVFRFAYIMAMRDATLRRAYEGEKIWIQNVSDAQAEVKSYVENIFKDTYENQDMHDKAFYELTEIICKKINESAEKPEGAKDFLFGNAQKLINMTIKYIYVGCYQNNQLRDCFKYCHCPMDSKMLKKIWNQRDKFDKQSGVNKIKGFKDGWSRETQTHHERYEEFQKAVRILVERHAEKPLNAVEYDFWEWED